MPIGAVDIGGTKISVAAVTDGGVVLSRRECATAPERGFPSAIQEIVGMLRACEVQFQGIGVACTGPVDPFTGIIGDAGTLPGWQGGNLSGELGRVFGVQVVVENDADASALGEATWGCAQGKSRFIYITVSTGIGGGIVLDGELYRGVEGAHPELGHQVIDPSGPLCYCGAHGCWESLASGPAMGPDAKAVCKRADQGDPEAVRVVERAAYYLGLGLANLVTLFAPDMIALGGGVMKSAHLILDRARRVVLETCTQVPAEKTEIVCVSLGADVGLVGAARAFQIRRRE